MKNNLVSDMYSFVKVVAEKDSIIFEATLNALCEEYTENYHIEIQYNPQFIYNGAIGKIDYWYTALVTFRKK